MKHRLHVLGVGVTILALMSAGTGAIAGTVHKISKGDTLWDIAKRYRTSVNAIESANKLDGGKPLKLGAKLIVPTKERPSKHKATVLSNKAVQRFGPRVARQAEGSECPTDIVRTALAYRGSRYVRGGTGRRGFDCSGFTRYIYSKQGVRLPHSSSAQASCGKSVDRSELEPGDLLFFRTRGHRISHVGIYVGSDRFVHASTPRNGVLVSSLGEAYYARRYSMARRITRRG